MTAENWLDVLRSSQKVEPALYRLDPSELSEGVEGKTSEELELGGPLEVTARMAIELPSSARGTAPVAVVLEKDFGRYESSYAVDGATLSAVRQLSISAGEIPLEREREFRSFIDLIKRDQKQTFRVELPPELAQEGDDPALLLAGGRRALREKDYQRAAELFERVVVLRPEHQEACMSSESLGSN